ncbi:hypothetical protein [Corynebacterium sp. AOP12-C2-36]|uniref:hypothetical protein n=1 Tax=Corynebacterium sp. AOP12-C2-36 TaxID=3457723 RepID=UPI0040335371
MKLYLYTGDDSPASIRCIRMYLELVARMSAPESRYLPEDATVWATVHDRSLGLWVLGETSTHVRVHSTVDAGACLINRARVSFGRTTRDAAREDALHYRMTNVPMATLKDPRSTILIDHGQPDKRVGFRAGSESVPAINGTVTYDPFTVIDLPNYTAPKNATTKLHTVSDAVLNGSELMVQGLSAERAAFVKDNLDAYLIDPRVDLTQKAETSMQKAAAKQCRDIIRRVGTSVPAELYEPQDLVQTA